MKKNKVIQTIVIIALIGIVSVIMAYKYTGGDVFQKKSEKAATAIEEGDFKLEETSSLDYKKYAEENIPVVVNFGSEGCGPCRQFKPTLIELNKEYENKAYIKYLDIWKYPGIEGDVPIRVIPTLAFFNADGTPFEPTETMEKNLDIRKVVDESGKHVLTLHEGPMQKKYLKSIIEKMRQK